MTYRDLLEALTRLSTDPRIHPSTPVVVASHYEHTYEVGGAKDEWDEHEPVIEIGLNGGELILSATPLVAPLAR